MSAIHEGDNRVIRSDWNGLLLDIILKVSVAEKHERAFFLIILPLLKKKAELSPVLRDFGNVVLWLLVAHPRASSRQKAVEIFVLRNRFAAEVDGVLHLLPDDTTNYVGLLSKRVNANCPVMAPCLDPELTYNRLEIVRPVPSDY